MSDPNRPVEFNKSKGDFLTDFNLLLQQKIDKTGGLVTDAGTNRRVGAVWGNFVDEIPLSAFTGKGIVTVCLSLDTTPVVTPQALMGGGTADFTIIVNRDNPALNFMKITSDASSVGFNVDVYSDVARTKLILAITEATIERLFNRHTEMVPADLTALESQTVHCTVTNNGATDSTYTVTSKFSG